ncbi:MAG: hypothetical protein Q9220_005095 [cf. Caloplaca sp. 1 TL-2023]
MALTAAGSKVLKRDDRRDYDCFEDPKLRFLPLAVQQKQIIVTCNYEARRHGLYKLQLVTAARKRCPEAIIVLGEDLTRFRNASKENYNFLRSFAWSGKVEKLGFDEVFLDVTDMVDYNVELINSNALQSSFFYLSRHDPTAGFEFDGRNISGHTLPATSAGGGPLPHEDNLYVRLLLGSHLAQHLRHALEEHQGYSSTVGISTSKLLSKLVGNVNKPKDQTTLLPPYSSSLPSPSNVTLFLDEHDIGRIPGIGFKLAQKIRDHVLGRPAAFDSGLVYGGTKEHVTVKDVRLAASMSSDRLDKLLGGPNAPKDIGTKVWGLVNGIDDTEVSKAREVPQQISIVGVVLSLANNNLIPSDTMDEVEKELRLLAKALVSRIRIDLTSLTAQDQADPEPSETSEHNSRGSIPRQWVAYPKTLRLSTRPRPPLNPDGTRSRKFNRISRSHDMPSFILDLSSSVEDVAEKLVQENILLLFRRLHPEASGWNLSLVNLCATNMVPTAASARDGAGREISEMFRRQEDVLKDWKVEDEDNIAPKVSTMVASPVSSDVYEQGTRPPKQRTSVDDWDRKDQDQELENTFEKSEGEDTWQSDDEMPEFDHVCATCGLSIPLFAVAAHQRFHDHEMDET